jgi:hypothetical protein
MTPTSINLTWSDLLVADLKKNNNFNLDEVDKDFSKEVTYNVIYTTDLRAKLDSICALYSEVV